ncbi:MAG TPA: TolC family protein [bacterium]|nr:TolC family protein [bacterium]
MVFRKTALFCFLLGLAGSFAGEPLILTLEEATDLALRHNATLSAAREKVEESRAALGEARAGFLPWVSGSAAYTKLDVAPFMPGKIFAEFTGAPPDMFPKRIPVGRDEIVGISMQIQQPVFTGFSLVNGYRMAREGIHASEAELTRVQNDLRYQVQEAYWGVIKAEKFVEVSREAIALVEGHVRDLNNLYDVGMITKNDLLKARVQLSNARLMEIQAGNALQLSGKALCSILGIPLDSEIRLTQSLDYEPAPVVAVSEAGRLALVQRPEIRAMEAGLGIQKRAVNMAAAGYYPTLAVVADLGYNRPDREYNMDFYTTWTVSVVASMNLFNWGATHYREMQARRQLNQLQDNFKGLQDGIRLEVTQTVLNVEEAEARIRIAETNVAQAEENQKVTKDLFQQGMATNTDYLDAGTLLTQARTDYISALADYKLAVARLKRAMGMFPKGE